jgi:DNA-binding CsgD family transcriptional regulator
LVKVIRLFNRYSTLRQPVGRPIGCSEAQEKEVVRLRRKGISLREIAKQTHLGLKTVRTVIAHAERTDGPTQRRARVLRIKVDRQPLVRLEARRKTRDIVRKQLPELNEQAKRLLKE